MTGNKAIKDFLEQELTTRVGRLSKEMNSKSESASGGSGSVERLTRSRSREIKAQRFDLGEKSYSNLESFLEKEARTSQLIFDQLGIYEIQNMRAISKRMCDSVKKVEPVQKMIKKYQTELNKLKM